MALPFLGQGKQQLLGGLIGHPAIFSSGQGIQPKAKEQDNNLCWNASKLAHKDVIPPKDKDLYYINVPEGGYGNGPKRLAKFKRSDSPFCRQSLPTQLPPLTLSSNCHACWADNVVAEEEACATASKSSASTTKPAAQQGNKQKASEPAANANSPPPASPPSLDSPRDRPSPSLPPESPLPPSPPPPPARSPTKTPCSIVEVVLRSPAPVKPKPKEPCRKEPSKPAAGPKETRRLKRKAENNRDEPATERQQSSRVVEPAVDKEAEEQGPSKRKIRPRMRPKRNPTPEPEPKSQLPPPPPPTPNLPQLQPQPQPQPEGVLGPKPREPTPAPDSPPTPKQTKRGRSGNIPDEESRVVKVTTMTIRTRRDALRTRE
ncbi:hypothetical protein RhiXN_08202 [Rhizoctonia solani]|uniref:Uncharacterized protein n=1 Tax=Rhizoctonia solani TaxID=456999 RepID=A0A8H8P3B6_9AGAM|nr:uncharacterized protein RhiXN_08202 [Rhizoctonia solani]QRW23166.1 hypothetical protein RhiXN_08202 [Rhizoctonia solani]